MFTQENTKKKTRTLHAASGTRIRSPSVRTVCGLGHTGSSNITIQHGLTVAMVIPKMDFGPYVITFMTTCLLVLDFPVVIDGQFIIIF
jgi:hypothetical protein